METGAPGRVYQSGEIIVRQGDEGYCMEEMWLTH
jgi:hypothetical protein